MQVDPALRGIYVLARSAPRGLAEHDGSTYVMNGVALHRLLLERCCFHLHTLTARLVCVCYVGTLYARSVIDC